MTPRKDTTTPPRNTFGALLISLIGLIIYSLCFFPVVILGILILQLLSFTHLWHFLFLPFLIYIGLIIIIISFLLITGGIIRLFNIRYQPGTYPYSYHEKNAFNWMLICSLYTPCRKLIEIVPVGKLKNTYLRLLGMSIGNNALIGGVIKDPCVTTVGNNVTMGEYAVIYGHIHNYEHNTIEIKSVSIGNNCVIGAGSIIMPGVTLDDQVTIAAGAVVRKNQHLTQGKTYAGIPAKELSKTRKKPTK
jgi:hypothetical protein